MYILVILLPLLSFLQAVVFGFFLGRQFVSYLAVTLLGFSFFTSCFIFYEVALLNVVTSLPLWDWFSLGWYKVSFGLYFDALTAVMLVVITGISFLVHIYSVEYMSHDYFLNRFLGYLSLFTFFMLILVTSDNFIQLFIGWEGVGLCSYLLINFWFTRVLANKAALKAMIINRIADVFFLFGILLLLFRFGTTDYLVLFNLIHTELNNIQLGSVSINFMNLVCFFLVFGALGKSAQIGFHTWLPDAMEGPTPVSSLLHAATMVTAGVFLILRCSPFFEYAPALLTVIATFGGITAFFAAMTAVFQWDLKKVIAYSTCSQLGYMFLACGLSFYSVALFHLFNHAFFKALLFLSAGSIIHALQDEQDMRKMGGLLKFLPFTFVCMLFGSLAIMGLPFLTGFYSKDLILELLISNYEVNGWFFYTLAVSAAFLTAVYSIRLIIFVFILPANFYKVNMPEEPGKWMTFSLTSLVIASIAFGFIFSDMFVGFGSYFLSTSLFILPDNAQQLHTLVLSPTIRNIPLILTIAGSFFSILVTWFWDNGITLINIETFKNIQEFNNKVAAFFYNAGYFNVVYNDWFIYIFKLSYINQTKLLDKGILEFFGPVGIYRFVFNLSTHVRKLPIYVFLNIGFMVFSILLLFIFGILCLFTVSTLTSLTGFWPILLAIMGLEIFKYNKKHI